MNANITRDDLRKIHKTLTAKALDIMGAKNADYAKDTDPLRNLRMFEEVGIVVRLSDKVARLRTFCERGVLDVKDESVEDTLVDIINYSVLFAAYLQDRKPQPPAPSNVISMGAAVVGGPFCNTCDSNLADFRKDNGKHLAPRYWCSNCACEQDEDTSDMTLLEQVA